MRRSTLFRWPAVRWSARALAGCLALLVGTLGAPARAFLTADSEIDGNLVEDRWPSGSLPVQMSLNNQPLNLLPNLSSTSTQVEAVKAAMQNWALFPAGMLLVGSVDAASVGLDGINLITFASTPQNRDFVGNAIAVTGSWYVQREGQFYLTETDIVVNPREKFATDGTVSRFDIEDLLTHELGHVLGLGHSHILCSAMFGVSSPGERTRRRLHPDDIAGVRALYGGDYTLGSLRGVVLAEDGTAIFGAAVTAVDRDGNARVGAMTYRNGGYNLPFLPPGDYQVYAEPLDGPADPSIIGGIFAKARTDFLTTFAGGNLTPAVLHVGEREIVTVDPIRVKVQHPALNLTGFAWWSGSAWREWPVSIRPGRTLVIGIDGPGLKAVKTAGFQVSGSDVTINRSQIERGTLSNGHPYANLPITARPGARPGSRNLYVTTDTERAVLTGLITVEAQ